MRFRGGEIKAKQLNFFVQITNDDGEVETEETFLITYIPIKNALLIPPATQVKICGGK